MKRQFFALIPLLSSLFLVSKAQALRETEFTAKIYDLKDRTKLMFDYKCESEKDGEKVIFYNTISNLDGAVLVLEKTVMNKGAVVSFEQDHKQLDTQGRLEVSDGKAMYTFTRKGKTKTDDERIDDAFVVTSSLVAYLQAHWSEIVKGETVKVRLGILDRMETIGFQFNKVGEKDVDGEKRIVLKMKPSSFLIAALLDPLIFQFTADGSKLLELEGRTNVKLNIDGKLQDFDGLTVYSHVQPPLKKTEKN